MKCGSERFTVARVSFDWWMLAKWAVRDEQPIYKTSTNPYIPRVAGTYFNPLSTMDE
jgi:hypothetical protein